MLRSLDIRDMLLIDRLELAFQPGLNVLTGETGAGKSILLDCLGFVLGWRSRAGLVRSGAALGEVTAVFDLPADHAGRAVLAEAGIEGGDELILRRSVTADGRKTAWVNDRRVSGEVLRDLSDRLIELHGQHDDRGLLDARGHRQMLDAFAGADTGATRAAWAALAAARRALAAAEADEARLRADEEFLRHAVGELDRLDPQPGEEALLDGRRRAMQAGARIQGDIARALQALGPEGAEGQMADAARWLEGVADRAEGRLEAPLAALGRALTELGEAAQGAEDCLEALAFDPGELERIEERLFAIRALARKHGVLADDLGAFADDLRARLAALDGAAGNLRGLGAAVA
ncbi:MAG: AAA family ATPase, partial [Proteobacteria bacterium]|nr:AAA family ATPase [Pseudomonadota bacterium]